jgi:hypothetical protein
VQEAAALDERLTAGDADDVEAGQRADPVDDALEEREVGDRGAVGARVDRAVRAADGTAVGQEEKRRAAAGAPRRLDLVEGQAADGIASSGAPSVTSSA